MARLPQPGGDSGNWGDILNDYLSQTHNPDGTLKPDAVGSDQLQDNTVGAGSIQDTAVTEAKLSTDVQTKLNTIAPVTSVNTYTGDVNLAKGDVGLGNVDNTSDVNKPVSTAQQTAITNASTADRDRANHTGTQSADSLTDGTTNKVFLETERTKLAGVATGATTNDTDANLRARSSHTGEQAISTVTGLQAELDTKRALALRVVSAASTATLTINADTTDSAHLTAQAGALTVANPTGTPTDSQKILIRIKDDGTARAITWDTEFRAIGVTLPTTTVLSKTLYLGVVRNSTDTMWDVIAVTQEA